MPFVDGPDCRLWVEVLGEGEPVTVFAHGITSSTDELRPLAARAPGTRVLFDFRGHGHSECPPEDAGYGVDGMRRDLDRIADTFGATQAFGISMGTSALLAIVAGNPDRFRRLALFLPVPGDMPSHVPIPQSDPVELPSFADLLECHPLEHVAQLAVSAPEFQPLLQARPYWRELVRARILRMNGTGIPRALRAYAGKTRVIEPDALRKVTAPVLIMGHEGDPIHRASEARSLAGLLPRARLVIWPEPLAMYDDLDSFVRLIGEFLHSSDTGPDGAQS